MFPKVNRAAAASFPKSSDIAPIGCFTPLSVPGKLLCRGDAGAARQGETFDLLWQDVRSHGVG